MDLAVHLEHAVRRFPLYHKYTLGIEPCHASSHRLWARTLTAVWYPALSASLSFLSTPAYPFVRA